MRSGLAEDLRALLPGKGLVFLSGGMTSSARRLIVDFDSGLMSCGTAGVGMSALGPMPDEGRRQLAAEELGRASSLAEAIWASGKSYIRMPPVADFDVRLLLCDGARVKDIDCYGPPMGEVEELYTCLWSLAADRNK